MRTVLSLAFLSLATTVAAQEVRVAPNLRAGDTFRLEVTRTRENQPATPRDGTSTATIDVRVLTATPDGITLEWEYGNEVLNSQIAQDPLMVAAGGALAGVKPVISLTADGEVSGLVNEADVLPKVQAAADLIRRGLVEKLPPGANRQGLEAMLAQVLSPRVLLGSATRDAQTYFGMNGAVLTVGETVTADMQQPNPIGGGMLPAKLNVRLESATDDTAMIVTTLIYDGDALANATRQLMEKSGAPVPPAELAKFPAMQMSDDGRFVFDRAVGLMREVVIDRRFNAAGQSRLDRTEIRLVAPPPR